MVYEVLFTITLSLNNWNLWELFRIFFCKKVATIYWNFKMHGENAGTPPPQHEDTK
jgi:hypothetical protein